jgi:putative transposase
MVSSARGQTYHSPPVKVALPKLDMEAEKVNPVQLEDLEEFAVVKHIPRQAITPNILAGIRELDEKQEIETFLREILPDYTKTPHTSTEIADIITTHITYLGQPYLSAFVNKGKSCPKVTSEKVAHQLIRLQHIPHIGLIVLLAVGDIHDNAIQSLIVTATNMKAKYMIVDAVDIARLFIATHKICPKDGNPYQERFCRKCNAPADSTVVLALRVYDEELPSRLQQLVEDYALHELRGAIDNIQRKVAPIARKLGYEPPTYGTVARVVYQLDLALSILEHTISTASQEAFILTHRQEASHSNAIWRADQALLDIWLLDDQNKRLRPWLIIMFDEYSRAIAGYRLSFQEPSEQEMASTLRQAIWPKEDARWNVCGIPRTFYIDRPGGFISYHLEQVAAFLGIDLIFPVSGGSQRRRKTEQFFSIVDQFFLSHIPGYALNGSTESTTLHTLPVFEDLFRTWLLEDYHYRFQPDINGAPQERWEAGKFSLRMPGSLESLDLALLAVGKGRVHRDGIHFRGHRFTHHLLTVPVGEKVMIRYDPQDMTEAYIFYRNTFICRAVCQEVPSKPSN